MNSQLQSSWSSACRKYLEKKKNVFFFLKKTQEPLEWEIASLPPVGPDRRLVFGDDAEALAAESRREPSTDENENNLEYIKKLSEGNGEFSSRKYSLT